MEKESLSKAYDFQVNRRKVIQILGGKGIFSACQ